MEYPYTKDILHVKEFLGHKEIDSTLVYIQLDKNLFRNLPGDSFVIRAAQTKKEAVKLGEVGFEPFVVMEGVRLFRKTKTEGEAYGVTEKSIKVAGVRHLGFHW